MKKFALGVLILVLLLAGTLTASAQEDECFERGGMWNADEGRCAITVSMEIDITIPLSMTQYEFATQVIDQFVLERQQAFLLPMTEYGIFPSPGPLTLIVDYEEFAFSEHIVSFKFIIYEYTGGAHGNTYFQTFTFDLAQQRVLTLNDVFAPGTDPLATIAPLAVQQLETQLGEMTDADWLAQGTAPDAANYANFVITPDALTFFFPPYQVAAYAAGPQTVSIPLAQLGALLAPPFAGQ